MGKNLNIMIKICMNIGYLYGVIFFVNNWCVFIQLNVFI